MPKVYLRKSQVAERYGTSPRNVERMAQDGRIPPPFYLGSSRYPLWVSEELDAIDRAATVARAAKPKQNTAA